MAKKSKRNSPKPNGNRAQRLAERREALERATAAPARPFEGFAAECDLVALREFVPSATTVLPLRDSTLRDSTLRDSTLRDSTRTVVLGTVLPGAAAGLVRESTGYVGLQLQGHTGDPAHDLACAIAWASTADPEKTLASVRAEDGDPGLADVIDPAATLDITVHNDFAWWIPEGVEPSAEERAAVQRAESVIRPSARLDGPTAAWWVDAGEKAYLRWVRPEEEDALMLALARVHARGSLTLGEGSRFAGSFRTLGLLVPVFDLDLERHPNEWVDAVLELDRELVDAIAVDAPLTPAERRSRDGLRGRQVTLRL
ncbi:MAG TPA: DUF5926 family protein [Aldersonia sp.]